MAPVALILIRDYLVVDPLFAVRAQKLALPPPASHLHNGMLCTFGEFMGLLGDFSIPQAS